MWLVLHLLWHESLIAYKWRKKKIRFLEGSVILGIFCNPPRYSKSLGQSLGRESQEVPSRSTVPSSSHGTRIPGTVGTWDRNPCESLGQKSLGKNAWDWKSRPMPIPGADGKRTRMLNREVPGSSPGIFKYH